MAHGGFSKPRLARMHEVMAAHVEQERVAGVVTLLSRRGETVVDTIGCQDLFHKAEAYVNSVVGEAKSAGVSIAGGTVVRGSGPPANAIVETLLAIG